MTNLWRSLRSDSAVRRILRRSARSLFYTAGLYRLLSLILLTPLAGVMLGMLLAGSGHTVLSNEEIGAFLLKPLGVLGMVVLAAVSLTIVALEQACLLAIAREARHRTIHRVLPTLIFALRNSGSVLELALRVVVQALLRAAPFAAAAGGVYFLLLTEKDINFYLDRMPPEFLLAMAAALFLALSLALVLLRYAQRVLLSLPILLFENRKPKEALRESAHRSRKYRLQMTADVAAWALATLIVSGAGTASAVWLARWVIPGWIHQAEVLAFLFGGLFLGLGLLQLLLSIGAAAAFALVVDHWYEKAGKEHRKPDDRGLLEPVGTDAFSQAGGSLSPGAVVTGVILGCSAAFLSGWWLLSNIPMEVRTEVVAHRGASAAAPENTVAAVARAAADGADWVEIDVQRTADDRVVVIHDRDLMRIAGKPMVVGKASYAELATVDVGSWFDPAFARERIPLLGAVLETCRDRAGVIIELKYYGWDEKLAPLVVEAVERSGMAPRVRIMSLHPDGIRQVKKMRPQWPVGLLSAAALGDLTRIGADFLAVHSRMASPDFVRRVQTSGQALYVWTVNDIPGMVQFLGMGVDGIITDEPALARRLRSQYRELEPIQRLMITTGLLVVEDVEHVDPAVDAAPPGGAAR